jgi:uncharacterized membrane-anchored protein YhcB (DUF1043 family)
MIWLYAILGGVVGGAIGWLFDRLTRRRTVKAAEDTAPRT